MRNRGYELKDLTKTERRFIRRLLAEDLKEARAYLKTIEAAPVDFSPNIEEAIKWEHIKAKQSATNYLKRTEPAQCWSEDYLNGFFLAYLLERRETLRAELDKATEPGRIKGMTAEELEALNAKAEKKMKIEAVLCGKPLPGADTLDRKADLIRQLETYQDQGPKGEEIAKGLLGSMTKKGAITEEEAEEIAEHLENRKRKAEKMRRLMEKNKRQIKQMRAEAKKAKKAGKSGTGPGAGPGE